MSFVKHVAVCEPTQRYKDTIHTVAQHIIIFKKKNTDLTLDGRREGRLRLKQGVHSYTYSWVEDLIATLLSPKRTAHLHHMRGDVMSLS